MAAESAQVRETVRPGRVFLDNAATSWPKPPAVADAMARYVRESGAPAGRSGYREAAAVDRELLAVRRKLARLLGADDPRRIIFTASGTDSLNLAIHGALRPGSHVVTTTLEHNSVLRPLAWQADHHDVAVTHVPPRDKWYIAPEDVRAALRPETALVVVIHASNVTGAVQPIEEIGSLVRDHGALLLVDAAQSAGHLPINLSTLSVDMLAAPGHKGLLGPLGTGVLYVGPRAFERILPWRQGGTGTHSEDDRPPANMPERFEPGNLNVPGILGLGAAADFLVSRGVEAIARHERELVARFAAGLNGLSNIGVYLPPDPKRRVGVVSVTAASYDAAELAAALDAGFGIQVRSGLHCAPRAHESLGTLERGGTVRFSFGPFTTEDEIDRAAASLRELVI